MTTPSEIIEKCLLFNATSEGIIKNLLDNKFKIVKIRGTRSHKQNNFFHGALIDSFVQHTGDTDREYMKYRLKELFLKTQTDKGRVIIQGTSELTVKGMAKFIDQCVQYLIDELGGALTGEAHNEWKEIK